GLTKAINESSALGGVNDRMPEAAQGLPGELRNLLDESGFPSILAPFQEAPVRQTHPPHPASQNSAGARHPPPSVLSVRGTPPDPALQNSAVVQNVRPRVLKVRGTAPSCSRSLEGTGFVIDEDRVMTNAHVVAGTEQVLVETTRGHLEAEVVHYDPATDVAVL